ncbi:hypothetical protein EP7_004265 [Isosphaeraceae bacterium EP7]
MNWPVKWKELPDTKGTVMAKRLLPFYESERLKQIKLFRWWVMGFGLAITAVFTANMRTDVDKVLEAATGLLGMAFLWFGPFFRKPLASANDLAIEFGPASPEPKIAIEKLNQLLEETPVSDDWQMKTMQALADSPHELEADHAMLGKFKDTEAPNLVKFGGLLDVGCLIQGAINSGKTMRAMLAIVIQILMRGMGSILLIDAKGDRLLMKCMKCLCVMFGALFLCFSNSLDIPTSVWSIFRDSAFRSMSPAEKAEFFNQVFGLEHGGTYGDSYFAGVARTLIAAIFKYRPDVDSWGEMYSIAMDRKFRKAMKLSAKDIKDATEAINTIRELAELPQINVINPNVPQIDIGQAMLSRMVIYFSLAPSVGEIAARTIGRMVARLAYSAARSRGDRGPHVYLVIDEINVILQRTIDFIIKQARDCRVSIIATMQNLSDAKTREKDFTDSLTANLPVKITFTAMDDSGRKRLATIGGVRAKIENGRTRTVTEASTGTSYATTVSTREVEAPWFGPDEIEMLNSTRELAIIEASPDTGFTRLNGPQFITFDFPMSLALVESIRATEFPEPDGVTTFLGAELRHKFVAVAPSGDEKNLPDDDEDDDEDDGDEPPPPPKPKTPPPPLKVRGRKKPPSNPQAEEVLRQLREMS